MTSVLEAGDNTMYKKRTILIVGDYMWPWYQEACALALESLGCEVVRFGWFDDFWQWVADHSEPAYQSIFHRIQYRIRSGPTVWRVNRRLLQVAAQIKPDFVWFYNVTLISPTVVSKMRALLPDAVFCQYSNDNPFSKTAKPGIWSNYLESIKYFDLHFVFRHSNLADYQRLGATHVHLLRAYFIPEDEYPVPADQIPNKFKCDVVFAGHYENDGRVEMLEAICAAGYTLNLFGGGWDAAFNQLHPDSPLRAKYPVMPATKADYRFAICGAKVALCFLSTLNQDTYTTRSFQIPAMKTAMLSQYTEDLASLYQSDVEAVFFKDKSELLQQLELLVQDEERRESIAEAGYKKVYSAGHDVKARMNAWLNKVSAFQPSNEEALHGK
jgi:spore maturation protein CgeB